MTKQKCGTCRYWAASRPMRNAYGHTKPYCGHDRVTFKGLAIYAYFPACDLYEMTLAQAVAQALQANQEDAP